MKQEFIRRNNLSLECKANKPSKKVLQELKRVKLKSILTKGQEIVIDFALPNNTMKEKDYEILVKQTKLLYDSNMNAESPFSLNFAGLQKDTQLYEKFCTKFHRFEDIIVNFLEKPIPESFLKKNIVYLTPDATQALQSLETNTVYVLGGLVDYQARKNITLMQAKKLNCEARRLPIPEYMKRKTDKKYSYSKVLTINQVFAILLKYHETKDWEIALPIGVPKRRGFAPQSEP